MAGYATGILPAFYLFRELHADAKSVQGEVDFVFTGELLFKPFRNGHLPAYAHLVQFHPRAFQLLHGLDKVTGIGPESGMIEGYDHIACFAGKAGEPLHAFPALRRVLASMRIGTCDDHGIPSAAAHHVAE